MLSSRPVSSRGPLAAILVLFVFFVLVLGAAPSFAVRAFPGEVTYYQPDGTPFQARIFGDERGVVAVETAEGFTVVKDGDWWVYADPTSHEKSTMLSASPYRVGHVAPLAGWEKHVRPIVQEKVLRIPREAVDDGSIGELFRAHQARNTVLEKAANGTSLSVPVLVILVEFSDWAHTTGAGTPVAGEPGYDVISGQGNSAPVWQTVMGDPSVPGGLNHYYEEASYGQFQWDVHVAQRGCGEDGCTGGELTNDGWYVNPNTMKYWGEDRKGGVGGGCNTDGKNDVRALIAWAIQTADADVDYAQFDADGNGTISDAELMIFVVHARAGQENYGDGCTGEDPNNDHIWSHKWNMNSSVAVDGKTIPSGHVYAIEPEFSPVFDYSTNPWTLTEKYFGVGVYAHEAFHTLGATDIYDTGYDAVPGGEWCLMDSGSYNGEKAGTHPAHIHSSLKEDIRMNGDSAASSYGWIPNAEIVDVDSLGDGAYQIAALGGASNQNVLHRLVSPNDSTEWFMIENRANVGYYDAYLPEHGLVVWHRDTGASVGNNSWPYESIVERAGLENTANGLVTATGGAALSIEDGQDAFTSSTDPDNALNNESASGLSDVACIGAEGSVMTYAYGAPAGNHVRYTGASVSGGTDLDPWIDNGETVSMTVGVDNSTCAAAAANDVSVSLSVAASSDIPAGNVTINPVSGALGNLGVGQGGQASFDVSLDCDAGWAGRTITFEYTITGSNFGTVSGTFTQATDKDYLWFDDAEDPGLTAQWSDVAPFDPSTCANGTGQGRWDWQQPTDRAFSGSNAYHTPEIAADLSYDDPTEVWVSPNIAIPGGTNVNELTFWQATSIPCAGSSRARLWISTDDGANWTRWDAYYTDGGNLGWEQVHLDLSSLQGATQVKLMFSMYTYQCWSGCSASEGWYLDDIGLVVDEQDGCTACTPPSAPTGLGASTPADFEIDLTWNAVAGATEYRVYRSLVSGMGYTQVASTAGTSHTDTGLSGGTTYYYVVRAVDGCESADSNEASATATGTTPNQAPTAGFTYSCTNLDCNFTDTSSDSDGTIASWSWTFGDGGNSPAQNPSHSYGSGNTYTVTLTVTDDGGLQDSFQANVTVTDPPTGDVTPPVVSNVQTANAAGNKFTISFTTDEPATSQITFTGGASGTYNAETTLTTNHSVTFNGAKNVLYTFSIEATDAAANTSMTGPFQHQND